MRTLIQTEQVVAARFAEISGFIEGTPANDWRKRNQLLVFQIMQKILLITGCHPVSFN